MVVQCEGSIDSLSPEKLTPSGLRLCRAAPAGSIPAGDMARRAGGLANLRVAQSEGSIDLSAPAPRPDGLRPCRSLPSGSIPAGSIRVRVNGEWARKVPLASKTMVTKQLRGWPVKH